MKPLATILCFFGLWAGGAAAFAQLVSLLPPEANLNWTASDGEVAGYNIYYGDAPGSYQNEIPAGTNLSATVTGLVFGLSYYFVVTAIDVWGQESDFSNEIFFTVPQLLELHLVFDGGSGASTNQPFPNQTMQSSTDLVTWQSCAARSRSNAWLVVLDPSQPQEFYRLMSTP